MAVGGEPTPEARLWLTPRDPYSLLASWTLSTGTGSRHPALWLRVLAAGPNDGRTVEQALPADVSHCFVQVGSGDTGYTAQIGYYADFGRWTALVESVRVRTPADNVSPESPVVATRAVDLGFPWATAAGEEIREASAGSHPTLTASLAPEVVKSRVATDSATGSDREMDSLSGNPNGDRGAGAVELAAKGAPAAAGIAPAPSVSSPMGGLPPAEAKSYWLVANAELVVYGATEPGSEVTVAGVSIPLRADGSFSCRFSLPAGRHDLPIRAVSPDGSDSRQTHLEVTRG